MDFRGSRQIPALSLLSPMYSLRWVLLLVRSFLRLEEYWEVEEEVCDLVAADACGGCGCWCHAGAMVDESW